MSWITDLYVLRRMRKDKLKEDRERYAGVTKYAYNSMQNTLEKEIKKNEIEQEKLLEEDRKNRLVYLHPDILVQKDYEFFSNYELNFQVCVENDNYYELILLLNEALFRSIKIDSYRDGYYFSRALLLKEQSLFSFFTKNDKGEIELNEHFLNLTLNSILPELHNLPSLNILDPQFLFELEFGFEDYPKNEEKAFEERTKVLEKWLDDTKIILNIISEVSAIESVYYSKPIKEVISKNFNKFFETKLRIDMKCYLYELFPQKGQEELDTYLSLDTIKTTTKIYGLKYITEGYDVSNHIEDIIKKVEINTVRSVPRWKKIISEVDNSREYIENRAYKYGIDSICVEYYIKFIKKIFNFNPFEIYDVDEIKEKYDVNNDKMKEILSIKKNLLAPQDSYCGWDQLRYVDNSDLYIDYIKAGKLYRKLAISAFDTIAKEEEEEREINLLKKQKEIEIKKLIKCLKIIENQK